MPSAARLRIALLTCLLRPTRPFVSTLASRSASTRPVVMKGRGGRTGQDDGFRNPHNLPTKARPV